MKKTAIRLFIEKWIKYSTKQDPDLDQAEKELIQAMEKDGYVSADQHNSVIAIAVEQAYEEGFRTFGEQ